MTDDNLFPDLNTQSGIIAGAMAAKYIAAYHAQGDEAADLVTAITADSRSFSLTLSAMAEILIGTIARLGVDDGDTQSWLDQLALLYGEKADAIVKHHRDTP